MKLSPKRFYWYMYRISNITYPLPLKKIICNTLDVCVGGFYLNSGNKETLHSVKPEKDL